MAIFPNGFYIKIFMRQKWKVVGEEKYVRIYMKDVKGISLLETEKMRELLVLCVVSRRYAIVHFQNRGSFEYKSTLKAHSLYGCKWVDDDADVEIGYIDQDEWSAEWEFTFFFSFTWPLYNVRSSFIIIAIIIVIIINIIAAVVAVTYYYFRPIQ